MPQPGDKSKKYHVFIAHAGPDADAARELHDALEAAEWRVFLDLDRNDLELGDDWDVVIPAALEAAMVCVALISEKTPKAYYQRSEIAQSVNQARADGERHRLVPVVLGGEMPYGVPLKNALFTDALGGLGGVAEELSEMLTRITGEARSRIAERTVVVDMSHQQSKWARWEESLDALDLSDRLRRPGALERPDSLEGATTLVLPLPFHQEFSRKAIETLEAWVREGGGLLLLGHYVADLHHETQPSRMAGVFGLGFEPDLLLPAEIGEGAEARPTEQADTRRQVWGGGEYAVRIAIQDQTAHPALSGVGEVRLQSACSIRVHGDESGVFAMRVAPEVEVWSPEGDRDPDGYLRIIHQYARSKTRGPVWLAALTHGKGRVAAIGSWKIFRDEGDNRTLAKNLLAWLESKQEAD